MSFINNLPRNIQLLWLAFFDKQTPLWAKIVAMLGLFYGLSPLDFIPDALPIFGQMDDIAVIISAILLFVRGTKAIRERLNRNGN